ncbi:MAG TPA: transposase [Flavipsychrobacter sp.]|nr:transposase [Flavipsychrobacter sp.]
MSRKYRIQDQTQMYFVTFTVVNWIDVFIRDDYREIFTDSIKYCQQNKGLEVYAWCIMTSHIHLIIGTNGQNKLQDIIRDLKAYTSRHLRKAIEDSNIESRKEWLLWMFERAGTYNSNNNDFQLWQQHSHPIELSRGELVKQRLDYLHNNPVTAGFVTEPNHWKWSSAYDYSGGKGIVDIILIE